MLKKKWPLNTNLSSKKARYLFSLFRYMLEDEREEIRSRRKSLKKNPRIKGMLWFAEKASWILDTAGSFWHVFKEWSVAMDKMRYEWASRYFLFYPFLFLFLLAIPSVCKPRRLLQIWESINRWKIVESIWVFRVPCNPNVNSLFCRSTVLLESMSENLR